jgi:hypothetical protein
VERLHEQIVVGIAGCDALERATEEHRAALVGDHHRMLRRQLERAVRRVVDDIAAGRLVAEPLTHVSLRGAGTCRQR